MDCSASCSPGNSTALRKRGIPLPGLHLIDNGHCIALALESNTSEVSAGPNVCRCTLSVSFTHVTTLRQSVTPACVPLALQVHPGAFLSLSRRLDGQNQLTRKCFSRQQFSKNTAEEWLQENKQEIAMRCAACTALKTPWPRGLLMLPWSWLCCTTSMFGLHGLLPPGSDVSPSMSAAVEQWCCLK